MFANELYTRLVPIHDNPYNSRQYTYDTDELFFFFFYRLEKGIVVVLTHSGSQRGKDCQPKVLKI